jgi:iduronate 2-sulfatase
MGYAVRTATHRYVEWRKRNSSEVVGRELYDHRSDTHEDRNVAADPGNAAVVERMSQQLAAGWRANAPPE